MGVGVEVEGVVFLEERDAAVKNVSDSGFLHPAVDPPPPPPLLPSPPASTPCESTWVSRRSLFISLL